MDAEQLRVYFPMRRALDGMFAIYQGIFGVKFERVTPPHKWIGDLQLWAVSDAQTGEPLGFFYLDLFPRDGKYHHFAVFEIINGKLLPDGKYQRPVVAMVCNFPPPQPDKPSLLQHSDVETIFHEFGHVMHNLLTRAKYARFSGSNVPRDFVEAPSQMLENWVWDKRVLDSFAADYRDPSKKIPSKILSQLKAAKLAVEGTRYRRQLCFGLTDLALHTQIHETNQDQTIPLANKDLSDVFLPVPEGTAPLAYFGHFVGYDAGYYGYAWADAIAADMATVFEKAPDGYFDAKVGRKLRDEIYAVGDSRDANVSIEKFIGRPRSIAPFLKKIGVESSAGVADAKYGADNCVTTTTNIAGDITTKVTERRDKDGKVDVRIESVFRGKKKILGILHRRNAQGAMTTSRGYKVGGDLIMVESDEDGDGVFETVVLHTPDMSDIEVFRRQADGLVKPVGTAELEVIKKMYALQSDVGQVMGEYIDGKIDDDKLWEEAQRVRQKAEMLEKQRRKLEKDEAK